MPFPAPPLILVEDGGPRRVVVLTGTTLPRAGSETNLDGSVRGATKWYSGSPIPTSQVLGPQEEPMRFAGAFEDRKVGIPGFAVTQIDQLHDMRKAANPVIVLYGTWRRVCRWKSFNSTPVELARITYEVELEVLSDGTGETGRVQSGIASSPSIASVLRAANVAQGLAQGLPSFLDGSVGKLHMESVVNTLEGIGDSLLELRTLGAKDRPPKARSTLSDIDRTRTNLRAARAAISKIDTTQAPGNEFERAAATVVPVASASQATVTVMIELKKLRAQVETLAGPSQVNEFIVVRQGETLHRIALARYGDSKKAADIAAANGLKDWTLTEGQALCLPGVPTPQKRVA